LHRVDHRFHFAAILFYGLIDHSSPGSGSLLYSFQAR
jgi:hypothetical protein